MEEAFAVLASIGLVACVLFVAALAAACVMDIRDWWQHRRDKACTCARDRNLPPSEAPCLRHDP